MRASVRARISVTAVAFFFVVLAAAATVVVLLQWRQMLAAADRSLATAADELVFRLEADGADPDLVLSEAADPLNPDDHFALLQLGGGEGLIDPVVAATPNLSALVGRPGIVERSTTDDSSYGTRRDIPIDDDSYRVLARPVDVAIVGAAGGGLLVVGENIDDGVDGARFVAVTLAVLVPAVTAAFGLAVWFLVGRTLSPVETIRRQVEEIGPHQLDRRVPVPATGDEISRLARTMNSMLDRVERASQRQERFVGDASHELRMPLTRMRTNLEVDLAADGDLRPAAETALRETVEMQSLVDDLLLLARLDSEPRARLVDLVDLDVVVDQEVERLRRDSRVGGPGRTRIDMSGVSAAVVTGRREQLVRIVRNLLDNAIAHAQTRVVVSLSDGDGRVVLMVDDDGPGVPSNRRDVIFDRFARLDEARPTDNGGTGLGLAIVRELVRGHGGTVTCGAAALGGARFEVVLPAAGQTG